MPKILILILASDNQTYYKEFQEQWERYMNKYDNIDCYFYKCDPTIDVPIKVHNNNTILIKLDETFENVYSKTIKVFEYFYDKLDQYDYIYRTNLSSFIMIDRYINYVCTLPNKNICSAVIGYVNGIAFPSGSGFTITPDVVKNIVDLCHPLVIMDDVTIGVCLKHLNIDITYCDRYDNYNYKKLDIIPNTIFHIRLKSEDRNIDIKKMTKLINEYYYSIDK